MQLCDRLNMSSFRHRPFELTPLTVVSYPFRTVTWSVQMGIWRFRACYIYDAVTGRPVVVTPRLGKTPTGERSAAIATTVGTISWKTERRDAARWGFIRSRSVPVSEKRSRASVWRLPPPVHRLDCPGTSPASYNPQRRENRWTTPRQTLLNQPRRSQKLPLNPMEQTQGSVMPSDKSKTRTHHP